MKIRIKPNSGIYGATGEVEGGTELTLDSVPEGWAGRYDIVDPDAKPKGKKTAVTNPADTPAGTEPGAGAAADTLKAEHHGGGKFNVTRGETVVHSGLSKADADAFNELSDEEKAEFVKSVEA